MSRVLIDLWIAPVGEALTPAQEDACRRVASPDELAAADRFRPPGRRMQALVARALARRALSHRLCGDPRLWRFTASARGRPRALRTPVDFNLAHCDGCVVCAVTEGARVGVDVERRSREPDMARVAARFVAPQEAGFDLVRLWTLKEALAKGVGLGLGIDFERLVFDLSETARCTQARRWRFHETARGDHAVALAWRGPPASIRMRDARPLLFES